MNSWYLFSSPLRLFYQSCDTSARRRFPGEHLCSPLSSTSLPSFYPHSAHNHAPHILDTDQRQNNRRVVSTDRHPSLEHPPAEICTSATILSGRRNGKGLAASLAMARIISSQRRSTGPGSSRTRRFALGTVKMMLSVASSPQGAGLSWMRLLHSCRDVLPANKYHAACCLLPQLCLS